MLERALQLLAYFADGCHCLPREENSCFECKARSLLKEAGYILDANGHWRKQ